MSQNIIYREALLADIESMTTIVSRSFGPESWTPKLFPDTATMRDWWTQIYQLALQDPAAHLLVAVTEPNVVVGVFTMDSSESGLLLRAPLTSDHGEIMAEAIATLKQEREEATHGDPNFLVELVACDREFQGHGIGRHLAKWACEIADEHDAAIFLNTSAARDYYTKKLGLGFEKLKNKKQLVESTEASIFRPRKSKRNVISS